MAKFDVYLVNGQSGGVGADRYTEDGDGFVSFWRGQKRVYHVERTQIKDIVYDAETGKAPFMFGMAVLLPLGILAAIVGLITGLIWGLWTPLWIGVAMAVIGLALPILTMAVLGARVQRAVNNKMAEFARDDARRDETR